MPLERKCRLGVLVLVLILMLGFYGAGGWGEVDTRPPDVTLVVPYFELPEKAELCGEAAPLWSADVRERFDREFTIVTQSHAQVYLWLKRTERYFPWVEKQLVSMGSSGRSEICGCCRKRSAARGRFTCRRRRSLAVYGGHGDFLRNNAVRRHRRAL